MDRWTSHRADQRVPAKGSFQNDARRTVSVTKVLSVEWRASRTGNYVPRVNYEAIMWEGRRLAHSSGS